MLSHIIPCRRVVQTFFIHHCPTAWCVVSSNLHCIILCHHHDAVASSPFKLFPSHHCPRAAFVFAPFYPKAISPSPAGPLQPLDTHSSLRHSHHNSIAPPSCVVLHVRKFCAVPAFLSYLYVVNTCFQVTSKTF